MNTLGRNLRLTTFGESHGKAMGGIIDGFPAGFKIDFNFIREELKSRRPGSSQTVTQRNEPDEPEFLSGINEEGITLGTPIGFIIRNQDNRSRDYSELSDKYRPNHADYTYHKRYGIYDYRGGGRASARETVNWVVAGALAQQLLSQKNIRIITCLSGVGKISFTDKIINMFCENHIENLDDLISESQRKEMEREILEVKNSGDSIGGIVSCLITGMMEGIGNPIFDKLHARLAQAMMSINAAKGFEYGLGMRSSYHHGSEVCDQFYTENGKIMTDSNNSGGIQGGITNGMPIFFNVYFKPTPTIMTELSTVTHSLTPATIKMKGRHDPCVAVRAVPVVKAMAALVIGDFLV